MEKLIESKKTESILKSSGIEKMPLLKSYKDYRLFLKDYYSFKKALRSGFSFRQFSALCGFKSPNYLQLIMKGERNLSEEMAEGVAQAVGLKLYEKDYFISLVRQENSKTDDQLSQAKKESLAAIKKMISKQIPSEQSKVFSSWQHLLVRELVTFKDFEPSGLYISKKLKNVISESEAEDSWALLVRTGFVIQLENGCWIQKDPVIDSGDGAFQEVLINSYHAGTLKKWQALLEKGAIQDHELGVLNIPINKDKIPEFRKRIRQFQDEIIGWLQEEKNPDALVQLGTYLIRSC